VKTVIGRPAVAAAVSDAERDVRERKSVMHRF